MKIKYIIYILILFYGCTARVENTKAPLSQSGAFKQFITAQNLFSADSYGGNNAWVVGYEATILHTGDGGKTWEVQQSPVKEDLYEVSFIDDKRGWIVGKRGTILHTTDGGKQWLRQDSHTDKRLFAAHFVDQNQGWAVGTWSAILHTDDGGKTWINQGSGKDRYYSDVYFIDSQRGWIVGEYGYILHTENGGDDWIQQECKEIIPEEPKDDFASPIPHLYGVCFTSSENGYIAGMDGIILKTVDGGKTWKRLRTGTFYSLYKIASAEKTHWAIGESGLCIVSHDEGATWQQQDLRTRFWLSDIVFKNKQDGWIIGGLGTILKTSDSGKDWKMVSGISIK